MSYLKNEDGTWKSSNLACLLVVFIALVLVVGVTVFHDKPLPVVKEVSVFTEVNNYYSINGEVSPLDVTGCNLLSLNSGEGVIWVCRK